MATKTAPTPEPPDGLEAAYLAARATLDDVRRRPNNEEPVIEDVEEERGDEIHAFRRIHPSPVEAAQRKVRAAEQLLHDTHGPAAVDLADARARHHQAQTERQRAEQAGMGGRAGGELARLIGAEEAAARHVAVMERLAARLAVEYERRCSLDAKHADDVAQATADLEDARQLLANQAAAAEQALLALVAAADHYKGVHSAVTSRLAALGFTADPQHDGSAHHTSAGSPLRVAGHTWISADATELLPRALSRVAEAIGERRLRDRLMPLCGVRQYAADALLDDVPDLQAVDRDHPAKPTVLALREVWALPEPGLAQPGGYYRDPPAKKRRISFTKGSSAA